MCQSCSSSSLIAMLFFFDNADTVTLQLYLSAVTKGWEKKVAAFSFNFNSNTLAEIMRISVIVNAVGFEVHLRGDLNCD